MSESIIKKGKVTLVGAGPGDPNLLTIKGVKVLENAEVVLYDRLIDKNILKYSKNALLIPVGKKLGQDCSLIQSKINILLVKYANSGKNVVRLKGGDPFIFGRGGEEILTLTENNIDFEVVPGVSSFYSAPEIANIPITHRGISNSFAVFTAKTLNDIIDWEIAVKIQTAIFLMGYNKLEIIVNKFLEYGKPKDTPIAIISRATFKNEKIVTGNLNNILSFAKNLESPCTIVIGDVVKIRNLIENKKLKLKSLDLNLSKTSNIKSISKKTLTINKEYSKNLNRHNKIKVI